MGETIFLNISFWIRSLLDSWGVPLLANDIIMMIVKASVIIIFLSLNVIWLILMERKISAYIQCRLGPNRVGPKGTLQTVADVVKLLTKEFIIPRTADKVIYVLAPLVVFVPPTLAFAVIPWGEGMAPVDMNIGVFYLIAVTSLSTI
ncbi:MAG: NADH-quinone oxidoreductase subunit H, partial [Desulfotomaculales bacterium]